MKKYQYTYHNSTRKDEEYHHPRIDILPLSTNWETARKHYGRTFDGCLLPDEILTITAQTDIERGHNKPYAVSISFRSDRYFDIDALSIIKSMRKLAGSQQLLWKDVVKWCHKNAMRLIRIRGNNTYAGYAYVPKTHRNHAKLWSDAVEQGKQIS